MPTVATESSADHIEASLRASLEASSGGCSGGYSLDEKILSSAVKVLLTKIEYRPAEKEYTSMLKTLQTKYINLQKSSDPELCTNGKEDKRGLANGTHDCESNSWQESDDGIAVPRVVIHPLDNVKLGWLRVYKIGAGLANLGNTCFLNATLQCLTYTPPLVNHLIEFNEHSASCKNVGFCMMCELQRHIRRALDKNGDIIRPHCILQKLRSIAAHMTWGRQEDAHEFLRYVMDSMVSSSLNGYTSAKLDRISFETTVVNQIFGGYHRSQVICLRCRSRSDTYDHFLDIMLDIKSVSSLEKAMENFVQPEVLDSENAYMCPNCKQKCPAKKRFTIHRAPNIATFQLKRFDYSRSLGGKITKHITFPEKFDMRPCMSQKQGPPIMYLLYAVLVHQGPSCNSGHYFCFVRNSNNLWYLMDDCKVRQVSPNVVLGQQAYLLFYTRNPNNGHLLKSPLQMSTANNQLPQVSSACSGSYVNGTAGNPVNEPVGVPVMRKPITVASNSLKPKNSLTTSSNAATASYKSSSLSSGILKSLPVNREKVTFQFKFAANGGDGNNSLCGGVNHQSHINSCRSPVNSVPSNNESNQQKHPRIVMHIKNGKVYNYQEGWAPSSTSTSSDVNGTVSRLSSTAVASTCVSSSLVPYAPDSSEESDQDAGRFTTSRNSVVPCAVSRSLPKCVDVKSESASSEVSPDSLKTTSLVSDCNSGTEVREDVNTNGGNSNSISAIVCHPINQTSSNSSSPNVEERCVTEICSKQRVCSGSDVQQTSVVGQNYVKVNATSQSQWLVVDSNEESSSVGSGSCNKFVNSTTGWTVLNNDVTSNGAKVDSQYSGWTVVDAGGDCSTKPTNGDDSLQQEERSARVSLEPGREHLSEKMLNDDCAGDLLPRLIKPTSPSVSECVAKDDVSSLICACQSRTSCSCRVNCDDDVDAIKAKTSGRGCVSERVEFDVFTRNAVVAEDMTTVLDGSVCPAVNGHAGQLSNDQSARRHKKRKRSKRQKDVPNDEAKKRKFKEKDHFNGEAATPARDNREAVARVKRRRVSESSVGENSSGSFELEWVEKTKETIEVGALDSNIHSTKQEPVRFDKDMTRCATKKLPNNMLSNGRLRGRPMTNGSATVAELLKNSSRGYGNNVSSWTGQQCVVDSDVARDLVYQRCARNNDQYNEELDRGRVKKMKNRFKNSNQAFGANPFQHFQDLKTSGMKFKFERYKWQRPSYDQPHWYNSRNGAWRGNHYNAPYNHNKSRFNFNYNHY